MPNWCYNKLTVSGDAEQLKDFVAKSVITDFDTQKLTFSGVVPMPEELANIDLGSNLSNAKIIVDVEDKGDWSGVNQRLKWPAWIESAGIEEGLGASDSEKQYQMFNYIKTKTTDKAMEQAREMPALKEKFGADSWYDWSCINWGTKWGACDSDIQNNDDDLFVVSFDTAWSPPVPWVQKSEEMYPKLLFTLEYEEEGMGFKGIYLDGVDTELEFEHYEDDEEELPISNTN